MSFLPSAEPAFSTLAKRQEERYPSPFVDRRYRLEARRADGSVLIGRYVSAPTFPRFPNPEVVPVSTALATYVEPLYFVGGVVSHYRTDFFSGLEPSDVDRVNHVLAQWDPAWVVHRGRFFQMHHLIVDRITEHSSVADELAKKLDVEYSRPPAPSYAESEQELQCIWRRWAGGMVVYWSLLMDRLIGEDEWLNIRKTHPALWLRIEGLQMFDFPLIGAWFKDPVRHAPYIRECIAHGVPVYYVWTPAIESSSAAELLRPVLERTRVPTTPPGLPPASAVRASARAASPPSRASASPTRDPQSPSSPTVRPESSPPAVPVSIGATVHAEQTTPTVPATLWSTAPGSYATGARRETSPPRDIWERFNMVPGAPPTVGSPSPERGSSTPEWEDVGDDRRGSPDASPESISSAFGGHLALVPMRVRTWSRDGLPTDPPVVLSVWGLEYVRDQAPRVIARALPGVLEKLQSMHREFRIETVDDFVYALLAIRACFDTLVYVDSPAPRSDYHAVSPQLMLTFNMTRDEAMREWITGARMVLSRPHAFRAAIQSGGILATIAREFMPDLPWQMEPTTIAQTLGCPHPVQVEDSYGHDDYLSDAEIKILIGFDWSTVNHKPCDQRSMFPPPEVWERVAHGVWSSVHQDWFELRKKDIRTGNEGPPFYLIKTFMRRLDSWTTSFRLGHRLAPS
ncbi:hypothetical protein EXIGLDRAFT_761346 [Exidia glandulosa HHB12029]|uniref:Uncharacterized protein n=1 Tax=Exidia glandulosa HHB12029 TaxID=1314781 RepID=A0A165NIA0_EXIGL|nr:hypothetical protein EXIGLDRAFT_761346 [Exidia glandulosa HHB12029]